MRGTPSSLAVHLVHHLKADGFAVCASLPWTADVPVTFSVTWFPISCRCSNIFVLPQLLLHQHVSSCFLLVLFQTPHRVCSSDRVTVVEMSSVCYSLTRFPCFSDLSPLSCSFLLKYIRGHFPGDVGPPGAFPLSTRKAGCPPSSPLTSFLCLAAVHPGCPALCPGRVQRCPFTPHPLYPRMCNGF